MFGRQLKRFRLRAGLERAEFGSRTGYSASTIAAFEQGRRVPPPRFIDVADELLDAGGVLQEMKEEVARAQYPAYSPTRLPLLRGRPWPRFALAVEGIAVDASTPSAQKRRHRGQRDELR